MTSIRDTRTRTRYDMNKQCRPLPCTLTPPTMYQCFNEKRLCQLNLEMEAQSILQRQEGKLFWAAVVGVFLSSQLSNSPIYLLLLWSSIAGLLCAYVTLRAITTVPNLLLHMTPPPQLTHKYRRSSRKTLRSQSLSLCPVCGHEGCRRHPGGRNRECLHPWDGLTVPSTVDKALSEVLEIVMQRFVYSWHRRLAPSSESLEDELRLAIRHAAAILLRRAHSIDIPYLVTHKLSHAVASHIHMYLRARRKLPGNATVLEIEEAVMAEYGDHIHTAMRGKTANLRYFRHLAQALVPILLPTELQQSRAICSFIQELFAARVFVPAMNVAAKPDFINKLLLVTFDPYSRLERMFGPPSNEVGFLTAFAKGRQVSGKRPLEIPVPELISAEHQLYTFMMFMKSQDNIHVLQVYLTLSELKKKVNGFADNQPDDIISQVEDLYNTYLLPTSPNYLPLETQWVDLLGEVLSTQATAIEKCERLKMNGVFSRLRGYIYYELLVKIYAPRFHKSYQFYDLHIKQSAATGASEGEKGAPSKKGDKWRQKGKQFKSLSRTPEEQPQVDGRESPLDAETTPSSVPPLCNAQVVDAETRMDGIKPYTIYVILSRRVGDGRPEIVKRRFKEFVVLDTKLHQFHGDIPITLPSKRAFRNMDKSFVECRSKELEQYLQNLIGLPGVRESQILSSFLSDSADSSLFLPESVGNKAGKMIKSVPSMLKREKGQHLEELLQSLLQDVESQPAQASPQSVAEVTRAVNTNKDIVETYLAEAAEDLSSSETSRDKPWMHTPHLEEQLQIHSIMDLLIYVAIHVYQVSPWQLTGLQLVKLLGEETVETVAYNFVGRKVELMQQETKIVQLVHLFRDALFFNKDPPRTEEDIQKRLYDTLNRLITYPNPLFVGVVGEQRYREGTGLIFEGLQCQELNKQLFFKLLDIILLELFPELEELN